MYPPVNPILLQLGPLAIHWYGLTMTAAIFIGTLVASNYITRHGRDGSTIWDMLFWILIPAIIGARLYFVFIQSSRGPDGLQGYLAHPLQILAVWNGGIHIYGAFIFGGIALLLYLRTHKLPLPLYFDAIGLGVLIGQAIGRLGNFINQELYGPPTTLPWGLRIDAQHRIPPYNDMSQYPDSVRFQPLFLYEMLWDGIGFFLLLWISRRFEKQLRAGDLFLLFLIWSPLGRFFIEFFRTDSWFFPGTPFDLVHLFAAIAVIGASITLFLRHRKRPVPVNGLDSNTVARPARDEAEDGQRAEATTGDESVVDNVGIEGQS